jgi:acyl carrier protein
MQTADEIKQQVRALVAAHLGTPETPIGDAASLSADLGADSLDKVSLIMDIEDEFDIAISDEDAAQLLTLEQLLEYVASATAAHPGGPARQLQPPLQAANAHD